MTSNKNISSVTRINLQNEFREYYFSYSFVPDS